MGWWKIATLSGAMAIAMACGAYQAVACDIKAAPKLEVRKPAKQVERWRIILPRNWNQSSAPSRRMILQ